MKIVFESIRSFLYNPLFFVYCSLECYWFRLFRVPRTFTFCGKSYRYYYHIYNTTWKNERVVEVPIVWEIVKSYRGRKILEVGDVLSHYFKFKHDVVDKYEKADGVINKDILDYKVKEKYDLIVSISTFEHIGFDERTRDPTKTLKAMKHLRSLLKKGGKLIVTVPVGFNPHLDRYINQGRISFSRKYCLKQVSISRNEWIQVGCGQIRGMKYGLQDRSALGLIVGFIEAD